MTVQTQFGIALRKSNYAEDHVERIKTMLTFSPKKIFDDDQDKDASFAIFVEDEHYLYVPRFFAMNVLGMSDIVFEHEKSFVKTQTKFKMTLRPQQVALIPSIVDALTEKGGLILNLDCAAGKCLAPDTLVVVKNKGSCPISGVRVGDEVVGVNGESRVVVRKSCGFDTMYEVVHAVTGELLYVCNSRHIIVLQTGRKAECKFFAGKQREFKMFAGPPFVVRTRKGRGVYVGIQLDQ